MEIHQEGKAFLNLINNRFKLKLFLISKLPLAFFAGVNLESANTKEATASIKFKWINQNPFRSIYFAALSMAAELSTGVLAMMHLYGRKPAVSMLVVANTAEFYKKATGKICFTCNEGKELKNAIEISVQSLEPQSITVSSIGIDENGDAVAKFTFTWSFKAKA
jgi:hypothetical protein